MRSPIAFVSFVGLALLLGGASPAPVMAQALEDSGSAPPVTPDPKPDTVNPLPPKLATAGTGMVSPKVDAIAPHTHAPNSAGCTPVNPCATVTPALDGLGPFKAANAEPSAPAAKSKAPGRRATPRAQAEGRAPKPQTDANAAPGAPRFGAGRPCMGGGNFAGGFGARAGGGGFRPGAGTPPDPNDPAAAERRAKFIAAFRARMAAANADPDHKPVAGASPCGINRQVGGAPNGAAGGFRRGAPGAQAAAPEQ